MEVATSITPPCTALVDIIHIPDDDDNTEVKDVSIKYSTPKNSKRKRVTKVTDPIIVVEEYFVHKNFESISSGASSSGTKKVLIDLSDDDNSDDEIQYLGSKFTKKFNDNFTCDICVDEKPMIEKFQIMGCNHSYCKQCTINYIASKLQQNVTRISCPVEGCNGKYEPYYCMSILPKQVFDRWGDALCEMMIMSLDKFYCPFKDCSALLLMDDEKCGGRKLVISESECPECRRLFCAACNVPWHTGIVCEEFQKLNKDEREREDILLMKLAKGKKWQRCPKCRIYVARTQGCAQMKCRCGCSFCYKCGAQSANHYCKNCGT